MPFFDRLVIATHNRKKAGEMNQILSARFPDIELFTLADFVEAPEPEETGFTYAENAKIKADSAMRFTGMWSLADDAGLEIDALDGAPGLYSKRFGGEDLPFPEKMARILDMLQDVPEAERTARFRCDIALAAPLGEVEASPWVIEATCEGKIAHSVSGSGGFGYDPILLPDDAPGRTMADLTSDEKHAISHRGKVLRQLAELIESIRAGNL